MKLLLAIAAAAILVASLPANAAPGDWVGKELPTLGVDYLGTEEIEGADAHKLRVTLKDGDVEYHYLDPDTMLEMRIVYERHIRGVERIVELNLTAEENAALAKSADSVRTLIEACKKLEPKLA